MKATAPRTVMWQIDYSGESEMCVRVLTSSALGRVCVLYPDVAIKASFRPLRSPGGSDREALIKH